MHNKRIIAWIEKNYPNGIDIYADYHDEIQSKDVQRILESEDRKEAFWSLLYNYYSEEEWQLIQDAYINMLDETGIEDTDDNKQFFEDMISVNYPDKHYLRQKVCVDIFVDSGDWDTDLGVNQVYPHYDGNREYDIDDKFCLLWLAKQQGYTKAQLQHFLYKQHEKIDYDHRVSFLQSIYQELLNCNTHMNSLVFLKKMTLRDLLYRDSSIPFHIEKDTRCGLFDLWNGAGGLFDITLDKDMSIDSKYIRKVCVDEYGVNPYRYCIHEVYGVSDEFWAV